MSREYATILFMTPSATARTFAPVKRGKYAVLAVFMQIMTGIIYSYPVIRDPLHLKGWTPEDTRYPYRWCVFMVAVGALIGGLWTDRKGPRIVASVGALLFGAGCLVSFYAVSGEMPRPVYLMIGYGLLGGLGAGLVYVTPVANLVKWYPDKLGTATGTAVMGSGLSLLFWTSLITYTLKATGVPTTFGIIAAIFVVCVLGGAQLFADPPAGWRPAGWHPPQVLDSRPRAVSRRQMVASWQFWALWAIFCLGAGVWLTTNAEAPRLIDDVFPGHYWGLEARVIVLGLAGLCSGVGRRFWGVLSDRIGREQMIGIIAGVSTLACLGFLQRAKIDAWMLPLGLCLAAFADGGYAAVMPAMVGDYFGSSTFGGNFGIIFLAWGFSGLWWPQLFAPQGKSIDPVHLFRALPLLAGFVFLLSVILVVRKQARRAQGGYRPGPSDGRLA
jgi:MFS transporter, OFA family, oxalate/formate antiporter